MAILRISTEKKTCQSSRRIDPRRRHHKTTTTQVAFSLSWRGEMPHKLDVDTSRILFYSVVSKWTPIKAQELKLLLYFRRFYGLDGLQNYLKFGQVKEWKLSHKPPGSLTHLETQVSIVDHQCISGGVFTHFHLLHILWERGHRTCEYV